MSGPVSFNPYCAPAADTPSTYPAHAGFPGYRSQEGRVVVVAVLLGLFALTHLAAIWQGLAANELVQFIPEPLAPQDVDAGAGLYDIIVVASSVAYLACTVAIGMFLYRANHNARVLAGPHSLLSFTPGWTVGWFFIPFANWIKPYRAVSEIWRVSQSAGSSRLPTWWAAWLVMTIGGKIVSRVSQGTDTYEEIVRSNYLLIAHSLAALAATVAVYLLVTGLHEIQQRHHDSGRPAMPG